MISEKDFMEKMKVLLDNDNVTSNTVFSDLEEWDSVSVLGYVSIALECGKKIDVKHIKDCVTFSDLYALLN